MNRITDSLFSEEEMRGASVGSVDRSFVVGADTTEQAEAIAQQCLDFLADPACDRVGIVFSGAGALPRLVANALARLDIPHHDGVAHFLREFSRRLIGAHGFGFRKARGLTRSFISLTPSLTPLNCFLISA